MPPVVIQVRECACRVAGRKGADEGVQLVGIATRGELFEPLPRPILKQQRGRGYGIFGRHGHTPGSMDSGLHEFRQSKIVPQETPYSESVGGRLGWWAGEPIGLMSSYMLSVVGTGTGLYAGRRLHQQHFD